MSAHVNAIFQHDLAPARILTLPMTLSPERTPRLHEAIRHLTRLTSDGEPMPGAWRVLPSRGRGVVEPHLEWAEGDAVRIRHPAGLELGIGRYACDALFGLKWAQVARDARVAGALLAVGRLLAAALGSPLILYVPTEGPASSAAAMIFESKTVAEIVAWLEAAIGVSAAAFAPAYRFEHGYRELDAYIIDHPATAR